MGIFNWFGEDEHNVFDYKPVYYDKEKKKDGYAPGSYIKGSLRDGKYQKTRSHATKAQNIIGIIGLLLIAAVLFYIAKFYTLL